jgi:hypothetical protein
MAERRMFAKTVIGSDAFLDMPASARLLYYDLGMRADDDGFVNSPKSIMRMTGASEDDAKLLIGKKFIIPFESGVVVIKHWNINNYIQKDRYSETKYKEEKSLLSLDENKAYKLPESIANTQCIQNVYEVDTQVRLGKDRLGKSKDIYGTFKNVKLTQEENKKLIDEYGEIKSDQIIEFLSAYREEKGYKNKSDYLSIKRWVVKAVEEQGGKQKTNVLDEIIREGIKNGSNGNGKNHETNSVAVQSLLQKPR